MIGREIEGFVIGGREEGFVIDGREEQFVIDHKKAARKFLAAFYFVNWKSIVYTNSIARFICLSIGLLIQ